MKSPDKKLSSKNIPLYSAALLIAAFGSFVSGYLLYTHYGTASTTSLLFQLCSSGGFNCEAVNSSRYATIGGIPLAGLGMFYYLCSFFMILTACIADRAFARFIKSILFCCSAISVLAIIPLAVISFIILKESCLFCILSWISSIILFFVILQIMRLNDLRSFRQIFINFYQDAIAFLTDLRNHFYHLFFMFFFLILIIISLVSFSSSQSAQRELEQIKTAAKEENDIMQTFYSTNPQHIDLNNIPVYGGNPEARVTIVEYFNFDCHACRQAYALTKKIINKYPGRVKLYLKNLPFDGVCNKYVREKGDGLTCDTALISIYLRGASEYKPFIDGIMSVGDDLSPALLDKAVASSGVRRAVIPSMIKSPKHKNVLSAEIEEAARLNIHSTPTLVINGRQLPPGLPPESFLDKIIQIEINRAYGLISN